MSRWFRFYDEAMNDPKILRLSDSLFRAWVTLLCLASKNDGQLPPPADIALVLRLKLTKVAEWLALLTAAGLIDDNEGSFRPHNWDARQFKSDVSNDRVKRHRDKKRNDECNVTSTVTVTPPETEQITDTEQIQNSEPTGSDADAPIDHRKRLFNEGLAKLSSITGKGPDASRSFVGRCLKETGDDAVTVLAAIEEAERNQVIDPSAWILARLKPKGAPNGRRTVHDAAKELSRNLAALDEPAPGLCEPEGRGPLRLLPSR